MVPPKKSKAARKTEVSLGDDAEVEDEVAKSTVKDITSPSHHSKKHNDGQQNGHMEDGEDDEDAVEVNIFKADIVEGKRKRSTPISEQILQDWYTMSNFTP